MPRFSIGSGSGFSVICERAAGDAESASAAKMDVLSRRMPLPPEAVCVADAYTMPRGR